MDVELRKLKEEINDIKEHIKQNGKERNVSGSGLSFTIFTDC
jgi:ribosomal protein S15P/S13E